MKKSLLLLGVLFALFATVMVPVSQATLIGPTQSGTMGTVTYTNTSIDAMYSPLYGSAGNLQWYTDVAINLNISFDYLIKPNSGNGYNNAYIFNDADWSEIDFAFTDGQTHHFSGNISLIDGTSLFLHAYAGARDGEVFLSNISVSDASATAVPEPGTMVLLGLGLLGLVFFCKRAAGKECKS